MPSPFPGMDPFIENRVRWQGFRSLFVSQLVFELNERLPQAYAAVAEERLVIVEEDRALLPDVSVAAEINTANVSVSGGSTATLERTALIDTPHVESLRRERQHYVEIVSLRDKERVVTVLEVLSPTNKKGAGRAEYHEKQQAVLDGYVNLVEIDLLREGQPTVTLDFDKSGSSGRTETYVVCLSRAIRRDLVEYWPFGLSDRLPRVAVPLDEGQEDIPLDLQSVFTTVYDRGRYGQRIDYTALPTPSLSPEDAEWTQSLLANAAETRKA